ncbi:MAG: ABC transporter substrate-binding protein [Chloroflexota bacterium]
MRRKITSIFLIILALAITGIPLSCKPATAKEPYKIGVMAAVTGPLAGTSAPFTQGFMAYMAKLNEDGGINGHPVEVMLEDDRGEAGTAGFNVKKLTEQGVHLIYNSSLSATFPPTIAEVNRVKIPALFAVVAPDEAMPPNPDPLIFGCGSHYATPTTTIMPFMARLVADTQGTGKIKMGVIGIEIPVSKNNVDNIVDTGAQFDVEGLGKVVPVGTADLSAVALAFKDWGANWIHGAAPGPYIVMLYDDLVKMGDEVCVMDMAYIQPFEPTMEKFAGNPDYYESSMFVPFIFDLPEHREISDALEKQGVNDYHSAIIAGWMDGKAVAECLKKTGWPVNTDKLLDVMENLNLDLAPVMGPKVWTATDHVGPSYWRIYHWEGDKIVSVGPWIVTDVLGKDIRTVETLPGTKN